MALASNKVIRTLWRDQLETDSLVVLLDGAMHGLPFPMLTPKMAKVWECLHLQMRKSFLSLWDLSPYHWHWTVLNPVPARHWWAGSVLALSHNQRENLPLLFSGMLCLHDHKRVSGGVTWPPETLWCSKSPGTHGVNLKGVGVGVPVTLTNQHVCSWRVQTWTLQEYSLLKLQQKQNLITHRNWVMCVIAIWEGQVILFHEGRKMPSWPLQVKWERQ